MVVEKEETLVEITPESIQYLLKGNILYLEEYKLQFRFIGKGEYGLLKLTEKL